MAENSTYISFQRPRDASPEQLLEWEILVARTAHQYASDEDTRQELLGEVTAAQIIALLDNTESGAVCDLVTQAVTHLWPLPEAPKKLLEAGALAALVRIIGARIAANDPSVNLQLSCVCAAVTADQTLIPKVAHAAMRPLVTALTSPASAVRVSAARLALALCAGKEPVWDLFIRREGLAALGHVFRLADEEEALLGLRIIECFCDKERYMFHVRASLSLDPVLLHSRSPNQEIATVANHILEASRFNSTWTGVATVDPHARAMAGRAQLIVEKDKYTNSLVNHAPKPGISIARALRRWREKSRNANRRTHTLRSIPMRSPRKPIQQLLSEI